MKLQCKRSPLLIVGLFMELIYLCTDNLAPLARMGETGSFLTDIWRVLVLALLILGVLVPGIRARQEAKKNFNEKEGPQC